MLKLKPDSKKSPVGGHHFIEKETTFKGDTFVELVKKLRDFRLHNNIPVGQPDQDILEFYAAYWPWLVKEDRETPPPDPMPSQYDRWMEWIDRTWSRPPGKFITSKEAKDRWAVCEKCPFNEQFKFDETDESAQLTRRSFLLRRGLDAPAHLGFCACHNADLASFSYFDKSKDFSSRKDLEQPTNCWVK